MDFTQRNEESRTTTGGNLHSGILELEPESGGVIDNPLMSSFLDNGRIMNEYFGSVFNENLDDHHGVEQHGSFVFGIDPDVLQDSARIVASRRGRPMDNAVESTTPLELSGELVYNSQPLYDYFAYSGHDGQERAPTLNTFFINHTHTALSDPFHWQTYHSGQPPSALSPGNRGPLADSATAESEHGDNLNTSDTIAYIHSAAPRQLVLQPSDSPIHISHIYGHSSNTTSQDQIVSLDVDSSPSYDLRYGENAQSQADFIGPSENNPTSQNTIELDKTLAFNSPEATALRRAVMDHEGLVDIIDSILNAAWYKEGRKEQRLDCSLQKYIPKRRSADAKNSPFGAFVPQQSPYTCLFCNDRKGRNLCRAIGHARSHFGYKIDGTHTNWNAKTDRQRRARSPTHECKYCRILVTKQNWARHERSAGHKQKESLSNAAASTSTQKSASR